MFIVLATTRIREEYCGVNIITTYRLKGHLRHIFWVFEELEKVFPSLLLVLCVFWEVAASLSNSHTGVAYTFSLAADYEVIRRFSCRPTSRALETSDNTKGPVTSTERMGPVLK